MEGKDIAISSFSRTLRLCDRGWAFMELGCVRDQP
jgi:hypothetical protein